jgi:hypothetical protein
MNEMFYELVLSRSQDKKGQAAGRNFFLGAAPRVAMCLFSPRERY